MSRMRGNSHVRFLGGKAVVIPLTYPTKNGQLMEETLSPVGGVAYFGGGAGEEGTLDCRKWLEAVIDGNEPLVKPEEALTVTKVLEAIYESARKELDQEVVPWDLH